MRRCGVVFCFCPQWRLSLLAIACLLLGSCAPPALSPPPAGPATPPGETPPASVTSPASETPPSREAVERHTVPQPDVDEHVIVNDNENVKVKVNQDPRQQREQLERRLQAVVTCLERARQAVVAAEVAGAGIEMVRPAIDALNRSEVALREAQGQWLRGDVDRVARPLDTAEIECRAAREFSQQT